MRPYVALQPGEHAPWFHQRSGDNPHFAFDTAAGRYSVLCFFASARDPLAERALKSVAKRRAMFDDKRFSFFGVTMDRADDNEKRVATQLPGIRYLFDFDGSVGKLYGAMPDDLKVGEAGVLMRRFWVVVSPAMRVLRLFAFETDGSEQKALFDYLKTLPPPERTDFTRHPPVIVMDTVFEPELCRGLVELYTRQQQSGDYLIEDKSLVSAIQIRVQRRILPELLKAFQFRATRMENYIIASLAPQSQPAAPHRDNTTKATAHRRFSVLINLDDEFQGGKLVFPEYGGQELRPPSGGACVFSSSLMHGDTKVTRGRRLSFQPYLYGEEAAKVRVENEAAALPKA